jgi:HTH-type transcriptional regulator / antitoxin HipB
MTNTEIGLLVKTHRRASGLSQLSLANLSGVGKTSVFDIEKGKPSVQLDTLLKVLQALNIKLELKSPLIKTAAGSTSHEKSTRSR